MINKQILLSHIHREEDRKFLTKALDKVIGTIKNCMPNFIGFCDPYQVSLCIHVLDNISEVDYFIDGGYAGAERKIIVIHPKYLPFNKEDTPIQALEACGKFRDKELTHRDFLGAVLSLGIKREKIGDILLEDGRANIIGFKEICEYLRLHLNQVSTYKIKVDYISCDKLIKKKDNFKIINTTVAALRLDVILGAGFETSRNSISKHINYDRVKVNWKPVKQPSYMLDEGDIISCKGKGRIILEKIKGKTQKGRYKVTIKRLV